MSKVSNALRDAARSLLEGEQAITAAAGLPPTVNTFLHILIASLTQYDMRLSLKDGNIHRLAHFLGAANKVAKDMEGKLESQDKASLEDLKESMRRRFSEALPPIKRTMKAIDTFLTKGALPRYPVPKRTV